MRKLASPNEVIDFKMVTNGVSSYLNTVLTHVNEQYCLRLAVLEGEFVWHSHPDSDELFIVLEGCLTVEFHDRTVELSPGQALLVPAGEKHRTLSRCRTVNLCFEKSTAGTILCGDPRA